jgi:hypothetical protein
MFDQTTFSFTFYWQVKSQLKLVAVFPHVRQVSSDVLLVKSPREVVLQIVSSERKIYGFHQNNTKAVLSPNVALLHFDIVAIAAQGRTKSFGGWDVFNCQATTK